MRLMKLLLLFATVIAANCAASDVDVPPPPPSYVSVTSSSTTVTASATTKATTTSAAPSTTESTTAITPSTTSTTHPSTPLTKPTIPSTKPTTSTTKPTTSTTKPTTSSPKPSPTPEPTKTTPKPTPIPPHPSPVKPEVGKWSVDKSGTNHSCIILQSEIQIQIENITVNISKDANSTGSCKGEEFITIFWITDGHEATNNITFHFENKTGKFDVKQIEVEFNGENTTYYLVHNKEEFSTNLKNSYKCDAEQKLDLIDNKNKTVAHIILSKVQVQAYHDATGFSDAVNCVSAGTPDVVPIAVGCALVVLVIIVLVAYLVGRKRSQARGYLSMFAETKREADYIPMKNLSCFN